jgi:hypothetical protein
MTGLRGIVLEFQELFLLSGGSFVCTFSLKCQLKCSMVALSAWNTHNHFLD